MNHIQTHSEYSWSLLDPRPVIKYVEEIDEYIVYWNGCIMPHLMALNMAMEPFGSYPTPTMKMRLLSNYKRIYYTNGFGEQPYEWVNMMEQGRVYGFLRNRLHDHIREAEKGKELGEILSWFNYDRARGKIDDASGPDI